MKNYFQKDHQTQKERLLFALNRLLLIFAVVCFFFSSYIANYDTTVNEAWLRWKFIMYLNFIIVYYSLRTEVKKILTTVGYKIVLYLLINFFIDKYFGFESWSLNDLFTLIFIVAEAIVKKYKKNNLNNI